MDPAELGEIPTNITVLDYVPQLDMLKQVSLFITHGGTNSVWEALLEQVPMLLFSQGGDQHLVANRVQTLNLGQWIKPNISAPDLRKLAETVMQNPDAKENLQHMSKAFHQAGGTDKAITVIKDFYSKTGQRSMDIQALSVDYAVAGNLQKMAQNLDQWGCCVVRGFLQPQELTPIQQELIELIDLLRKEAGLPAAKISGNRFDYGFAELIEQQSGYASVLFNASRRLTSIHQLSVAEKMLHCSKQLMQTRLVMTSPYKTIRIDTHQREDYLLPCWILQLRYGNFAHPYALRKRWPCSHYENQWFDETHPEYVVGSG